MDLVTFRATYPGLYQEASDAGRDAELERVAAHLELARAAGTTPDKGILSGAEPGAMLDFYRASASSSDGRSAALVRVCERLELTPARRGGQAGGFVPDPRAAQKDARDLGDRMADLLGLPPDPLDEPSAPPSAIPASPSRAMLTVDLGVLGRALGESRASSRSSAAKDLGDRMADAMGLPEVD